MLKVYEPSIRARLGIAARVHSSLWHELGVARHKEILFADRSLDEIFLEAFCVALNPARQLRDRRSTRLGPYGPTIRA